MPSKKKDEDELDLKELLGLDNLSSKKKTKKELSEDQKQILRDRLVKMREIAKANREAKKTNTPSNEGSSSIKTEDIFEKRYKDNFDMLSHKLNTISNDVAEMKLMKQKKAEDKSKVLLQKKEEEIAKQNALELEKQREIEVKQKLTAASIEKQNEPAVVNNVVIKDPPSSTPENPAVKLSFRQRFKNSAY